MQNDVRAKNPIKWEVVFEGNGFGVTKFTGDKNDWIDFKFPSDGVPLGEFTFASCYESGCWEMVHAESGDRWTLDRDMPNGHRGGVPVEGRPGGVVRAYCVEDGTVRLCVYPINESGMRSFEPMDAKHVCGGGEVVVPKGGVFILSIGSATCGDETFAAPFVVTADKGDAEFVLPAGSYGLGVWKK